MNGDALLDENITVSSALKAWIDQVVRLGKTFAYGPNGREGLLSGKRVVAIPSRGGAYRPGTPTEQFDFQEPYLRQVLGFTGITDVTFIHAENQARGTRRALAGSRSRPTRAGCDGNVGRIATHTKLTSAERRPNRERFL